ncbi:MAG: GNAT family N-acetyltransferase [Nitrospirae bacterium]|nr:GNAT family N-acetyltransferase [Nitrospirota bacterium]
MDRLKQAILQHGLIGCLILAASSARRYLCTVLYQHECHVWYAAATSAIRAERPLSTGLELQRAGPEHLDMLSRSNLCGRSVSARYLAAGADLWIVREAERAAFCCWIFRGRMPIVAARGGWKELPLNTVCLEASVTGADYRGRGIAPAAWSLIAQILEKEGLQTIITKVEVDNMPSRRAVLKTGFREVAVMDYLQVGGVPRIRVMPWGEVHDQDREMLIDLQKLTA